MQSDRKQAALSQIEFSDRLLEPQAGDKTIEILSQVQRCEKAAYEKTAAGQYLNPVPEVGGKPARTQVTFSFVRQPVSYTPS